MALEISNNAYQVAKERLGLKKKAIERIASRAFMDGINAYESCGQLQRYFEEVSSYQDRDETVYKIYGENVYIFAKKRDVEGRLDFVLVTIYAVPKELRNQVRSTFKRCMAA